MTTIVRMCICRNQSRKSKHNTPGWTTVWLAACLLTCSGAWAKDAAPQPTGATVTYRLPATEPLPKTYRVTLAVVDPKNSDWIISQFARGVVRTVTAENHGEFSEIWDGLDDNFMAVPPGEYGVKGIFMPAEKWVVDGEFHSITPKFVTGASSWMPTPEQWNMPEPFGGDPCAAPLADVAVSPNGIAVFHYQYLENGLHCPMFDLKKPVNLDQFLRAFNSGGTAGGSSVATDGKTVWAYSTGGGPRFVYRADEKPFGSDSGAYRNHVYRPEGLVTSIAAYRDAAANQSFVAIAQRAKLLDKGNNNFVESETDFIDKITLHNGDTGVIIAERKILHPRAITISGSTLYALHQVEAGGFAVSSTALMGGIPQGEWQQLFIVPADMDPFDLKVDSHGRFYLSDPAANHVYQLDRSGKVLLKCGAKEAQESGTYDPATLMSPGKLATWTDGNGNDRLIIVEQSGPNRAAEWGADGKLIREFLTLQTHANDGYAVDPEHADQIYLLGHGGWLTRFKVDLAKRTWTPEAVWPSIGTDPKLPDFDHPKFIRLEGRSYLACSRSYNIYRLEKNRWILSAGIVRETVNNKRECFLWSDSNGDGIVQETEYRTHPMIVPGQLLRYHGEQWIDDLSLIALNQSGPDVWRLAPKRFDSHGNPIFEGFEKLLTDPVFVARSQGKADATHGGNELDEKFSSDWALADGSIKEGFYVSARGGKSFSANEGSQTKISRYVPDGKGGFQLKWRTGREAMQRLAEPGEIYGAIHLRAPINGLLSIIDQSRCGVLLYTVDGLYVDTVFPDGRRFSPAVAGVYPLPGEFFAGMIYPDTQSGKVYFGMGKVTPMIYEAQGWSLRENPVQPLADVQKSVRITAAQIGTPPEIALSVRGGAGAARIGRFAPALGGVSLDGSMAGWESCQPIHLKSDDKSGVEVRCLYDPEHIYLRWHAQLAGKFKPAALQPLDRIFTHDRLADTLSLYLQGDPSAAPGGPAEGRAGDVRMVFGLFEEGGNLKPVALGMYPKWSGAGKGIPLTYATPTGKATFEHVGSVDGAQLFGKVDEDEKGFVIVAAIPRGAIPGLPTITGDLRTMANFSATFAGHNKFWWANSDGSASRETYDEPTEARLYPGSWAPVQFQPLTDGVVIRNWMILGPFGGPGAEKFEPDAGGPMKDAVRAFSDAAKYPPDDGKVDLNAVYTGYIVKGYWPNPGEVRWKAAAVADLDPRVTLGPSGQVWYGATWIYSPADVQLDFNLQGHPQTYLRFFLNGEPIHSGEIKSPPGVDDHARPVSTKSVALRAGWNKIEFRGFCVGYPPFKAGLIVAADPEKLWKLKFTALPPEK